MPEDLDLCYEHVMKLVDRAGEVSFLAFLVISSIVGEALEKLLSIFVQFELYQYQLNALIRA
jgi:hypothetical protein